MAPYLAELLLKKNYLVVGTHRNLLVKKNDLNNSYFKNIKNVINDENFVLEYGDMQDSSSFWKLINEYKPDEIYNLAAQSHVNLSFKSSETTAEINALGVLSLLNIIRDIVPQAPILPILEFGHCMGITNRRTSMRTGPFIPSSPYGCSKLFAHHMVNVYRRTYGLYASCGICFNHESPRARG